jgi:hypothetical protein
MLRRIFAMNPAITGADMAAAPPKSPRARLRLPLLGMALLASGCSSIEMPSLPSVGDMSLGSVGDMLWAPFMGPSNVVASNSLTVQRVRGGNPSVEPLVPESGNVWPAEEAPRPTLLGNPDEAMRNIPAYRPSLIEGAPPAASPVATPSARPSRRGSSTPPALLGAPGDFARSPAMQAAPGALSPPPRRREGEAMTTPQGGSVTATGGSSRMQGFTGPQGGGAVIRDGNVETWIGPDGRTSTRIVPN